MAKFTLMRLDDGRLHEREDEALATIVADAPGATTRSAAGVTRLVTRSPTFEPVVNRGRPMLVHGESIDADLPAALREVNEALERSL